MTRLYAILTAVLICACGSKSAPVSFSVTAARATAPSQALVLASGIDVQRVRLNIGRLKLEPSGTAAATTTGAATFENGSDDSDAGTDHEDGEADVSEGPFLVDLDATALTGAVTKVFDANVPAGTYHEFRFEVLPSTALQNASVIVDGTIDGQAFTFTSSLHASQKSEGSFVVGAGSANITLAFDPSNWFGAAAATRLDPRDELNRAAIETNIRASLNAFQDDDRSGHENHEGEDGGHH
ncbi:MAG TPA: hypothetical protein VFL36_07995 [Myxococcales bacterium]|nr:hypothetical protein [Myxococcales bacterium]